MTQAMSHSPREVAESYAHEWNTAAAPLDFSPASLDTVGVLASTMLHTADEATPYGADELVRVSCYVGEVVRRSLGGEWSPAGGGADMLRGVAGRTGEAGIVIPLSDLLLVISGPAPSLTSWYHEIASRVSS